MHDGARTPQGEQFRYEVDQQGPIGLPCVSINTYGAAIDQSWNVWLRGIISSTLAQRPLNT